LVFVEGERRKNLEKNPRCNVSTNNKLNCILYLICSERKGAITMLVI